MVINDFYIVLKSLIYLLNLEKCKNIKKAKEEEKHP